MKGTEYIVQYTQYIHTEGNGWISRHHYFQGMPQLLLSTAKMKSTPAPSSLKQTTRLLKKKMKSAFKIMSYFEKYYISLLFTVNMQWNTFISHLGHHFSCFSVFELLSSRLQGIFLAILPNPLIVISNMFCTVSVMVINDHRTTCYPNLTCSDSSVSGSYSIP